MIERKAGFHLEIRVFGSGFASCDLGPEVPPLVPVFTKLSLAHKTRSVQFSGISGSLQVKASK